MQVMHPWGAGLDVPQKTVVACVVCTRPEGQVQKQVRTFETMTGDLLTRSDWLAAQGVNHIAMASTGVSGKPVYHLWEGRFGLMLVHAHHIKNVPGRQTDVKDAEWIAQWWPYGLLSPSFVPPPEIRELRDLTRQRTQRVRDRATVVNRVHKVLQEAHSKLASVVTDVLGQSGRAMIAALIAGQTDPDPRAELARGSLRQKPPQLGRALEGRVTEHQRFLLRTLLRQEEQLEGLIGQYDAQIAEVMAPFAQAAARMRQIPGIGARAAEVLVAEIGVDRERFPTAGHLASWAGRCPGNDPSGGNRRSGRTTQGSQGLRSTLVPVAWAAIRTKATYLQAVYRRWAPRLGTKKALVAVGPQILRVISTRLKPQTDSHETGPAGQAA